MRDDRLASLYLVTVVVVSTAAAALAVAVLVTVAAATAGTARFVIVLVAPAAAVVLGRGLAGALRHEANEIQCPASCRMSFDRKSVAARPHSRQRRRWNRRQGSPPTSRNVSQQSPQSLAPRRRSA